MAGRQAGRQANAEAGTHIHTICNAAMVAQAKALVSLRELFGKLGSFTHAPPVVVVVPHFRIPLCSEALHPT